MERERGIEREIERGRERERKSEGDIKFNKVITYLMKYYNIIVLLIFQQLFYSNIFWKGFVIFHL